MKKIQRAAIIAVLAAIPAIALAAAAAPGGGCFIGSLFGCGS